jgi:hypothetical protein
MKKLLWVTLSILIPFKIFGQIQIDQVGDNWKPQVVEALELIKKTDTNTYKFVLRHCKKIYGGRELNNYNISGRHVLELN